MSLTTNPAPARTDLSAPEPITTTPPATRPFRVHGAVLTGGALAWAGTLALFGLNPEELSAGYTIGMVGAGLFQVGLLALLRVLWRTRALGTGRVARTFLVIENVLVALAMGSTTADATGLSNLDQLGWALLDACWPFSMLGMFAIGIRIAVAGRWPGVSRFWPMVAESWALVVIPTLNVFGPAAAAVVAPLHLVIGYATLGLIVARKTQP